MNECEGEPGFLCIDGWKYTPCGGMIFPTNQHCEKCNPPEPFMEPELDLEKSG